MKWFDIIEDFGIVITIVGVLFIAFSPIIALGTIGGIRTLADVIIVMVTGIIILVIGLLVKEYGESK